jgi:hypothetical protein
LFGENPVSRYEKFWTESVMHDIIEAAIFTEQIIKDVENL